MIRGHGIFLAIALCMAGSLPLLVSPLPAQQPSDRAYQICGKLMCMWGCNQVLSQCNHVGCTVSTSMLKEVDQALARGDSEDAIAQAFVQEFGTKVYAEPPHSGFSLVAWSMPAVYLAVGLVLVLFVITRWRKRPVPAVSGVASSSRISPEMVERARLRA